MTLPALIGDGVRAPGFARTVAGAARPERAHRATRSAGCSAVDTVAAVADQAGLARAEGSVAAARAAAERIGGILGEVRDRLTGPDSDRGGHGALQPAIDVRLGRVALIAASTSFEHLGEAVEQALEDGAAASPASTPLAAVARPGGTSPARLAAVVRSEGSTMATIAAAAGLGLDVAPHGGTSAAVGSLGIPPQQGRDPAPEGWAAAAVPTLADLEGMIELARHYARALHAMQQHLADRLLLGHEADDARVPARDGRTEAASPVDRARLLSRELRRLLDAQALAIADRAPQRLAATLRA
jgi:hypothetical protein